MRGAIALANGVAQRRSSHGPTRLISARKTLPWAPPCGLRKGGDRHFSLPQHYAARLRISAPGAGPHVLCGQPACRYSFSITAYYALDRPSPVFTDNDSIDCETERTIQSDVSEDPFACWRATLLEMGVAKASTSGGGSDRPAEAFASARPN